MAKQITLNHICKIEGHANLTLKIEKNSVRKCELKAHEGARFFEGLLLGKKIEDIQEIVSRICGICSCAHSVACVQGLEEALKISPSSQQKFIREIILLSERIRSHATHLYFMSLPDYLGATSAITLSPEHRPKVMNALKIITLGNKIIEKFGGREIHPFLKVQEDLPHEDFKELLKQIKKTKPTILKTIKLFANLEYSGPTRKTDYLSLSEKNSYAAISGKIKSVSDNFKDDDYKTHLKENIKEYATSKFVLHENHPFQVGALARISNNQKQLDEETSKQLEKCKIDFTNPHHNLIAQSLEILQSTNRIEKLLQSPPKALKHKSQIPNPKSLSRSGTSAVEAPRGTLFHEYKIKNGKVTYCNIITPTAQNLNMMEADITRLVNELLEKKTSQKEIVAQIEKLIRAYDPCFSCSTHFLKVNWL